MKMSTKKVLLVGARGHARAVADVIKAESRYQVAGLIDSFQEPGAICFEYKVLGGEKDVSRICNELRISHMFVAIGDNFQRESMIERIKKVLPNIHFISPKHPSVVLGSDVEIGEGTVIMPGVIVVSGSSIAEGCLLNTASSLDHDCAMKRCSSLAPGVAIGGRVYIGARSSIGIGASVKNDIRIGSDTVIGAGAVVVKDIPDNVLAYGVPCRVMRLRRPDEPYL
jgi:sugar O-acyltransferase (sialic acid O-acetyltransferase NeuD family)